MQTINRLLLAAVFKLFGIYTFRSLLVSSTLNCAFSALTCLPIFYIGDKVFGRKVATLAGWVWTFLPTAVTFPIQWVWDTSLSALLLGLLLGATSSVRGSNRLRVWAGSGALWALSALTNLSLLSLLPFLLAWLALQGTQQEAGWVRVRSAPSRLYFFSE